MEPNTISQDEVAALLGRSLTPTEDKNFSLYIDIAKLRLNDLLCTDVSKINPLPSDLKLVWARFFGALSAESAEMQSNGIQQKRVEDFYITYRDSDGAMADLLDKNGAIIAKYAQCGSGIRHGRTIPVNDGGYNLDDSV